MTDASRYPIGGCAKQPTGIPREVAALLDTGADTIWGEIVGTDELSNGFCPFDHPDRPPWPSAASRRGDDGKFHPWRGHKDTNK